VCTVLLRFAPGTAAPVLLAAVRDEFVDRSFDPPAAHWPEFPGVVGGRDRTAGGTWLAVRPATPVVAALLNGPRLPEVPGRPRPTRGALPLRTAFGQDPPVPDQIDGYDGFHLLRATRSNAVLWSWDGVGVTRTEIEAGDHIIVNAGLDAPGVALVTHFTPLLRRLPPPPLVAAGRRSAEPPGRPTGAVPTGGEIGGQTDGTEQAWGAWVDLLQGAGLAPDDPRALLIRREHAGRSYGSTSACLVALTEDSIRYDFTGTPETPSWSQVGSGSGM
jgi:hypothetical protein